MRKFRIQGYDPMSMIRYSIDEYEIYEIAVHILKELRIDKPSQQYELVEIIDI